MNFIGHPAFGAAQLRAAGKMKLYLQGLCLGFEGFGSIGEGMSFLSSLRVHAAAAGLGCCLTSLGQLGRGHALHGMPLQAIADDQSAWLDCLQAHELCDTEATRLGRANSSLVLSRKGT